MLPQAQPAAVHHLTEGSNITNSKFSKRLMGLAVATVCLVVVGSALAAHPKKGKKYSGVTSAPALRGFKPPVQFKVSSSGKSILGFKWAGGGCLGGIDAGPGNPWKDKKLNYAVGTISVAADGSFSVMNVKSSHKFSGGQKTVTTSSVTGSFSTSTKASGSITFKQKSSGGGSTPGSCGPKKVKFTATAM
ncbi:MAG TPA: hypothetical protein VIX82_00140 [Solirubrobacteraceae bacterium]